VAKLPPKCHVLFKKSQFKKKIKTEKLHKKKHAKTETLPHSKDVKLKLSQGDSLGTLKVRTLQESGKQMAVLFISHLTLMVIMMEELTLELEGMLKTNFQISALTTFI
jgi:ribosomal protein L16 Arg81 hydroxylase